MPGAGQNAGMSEQEQKMVKYVQAGMESCIVKSCMAGGAGFALGGVFGLFMASVSHLLSTLQSSKAMDTAV